MRILGVETSFDDTGVAIYDSNLGLLVNELRQQNRIHSKYGGVVPELAYREYIFQVAPLIKYVIKKYNINLDSIDGIAYTAGPGLPGSLLVGAAVSCALAYTCNVPAIPVNHMEAHLLSPMINNKSIAFPFIGLLISGKHTQLINVYKLGCYKILGTTLDDAIGEVFDKVAQELHLGYPGGALLSQFAKKGNLGKFIFPLPMKNNTDLNFSFSGLKTFTLNLIRKHANQIQDLYDIACQFEYTVFYILRHKALQALKKTGYRRLVIAGGVSANFKCINLFQEMCSFYKTNLYYPEIEFCTDNAAMVAYLGMLYLRSGLLVQKTDIFINPHWSIEGIKNDIV